MKWPWDKCSHIISCRLQYDFIYWRFKPENKFLFQSVWTPCCSVFSWHYWTSPYARGKSRGHFFSRLVHTHDMLSWSFNGSVIKTRSISFAFIEISQNQGTQQYYDYISISWPYWPSSYSRDISCAVSLWHVVLRNFISQLPSFPPKCHNLILIWCSHVS